MGNVNGKSCDEYFISLLEKNFINQGYQVVKNKKFTGGFITRHYSQIKNVATLQIEIRYHVYLDKNQLDKPESSDWNVAQFTETKNKFKEVFTYIVNHLR